MYVDCVRLLLTILIYTGAKIGSDWAMRENFEKKTLKIKSGR